MWKQVLYKLFKNTSLQMYIITVFQSWASLEKRSLTVGWFCPDETKVTTFYPSRSERKWTWCATNIADVCRTGGESLTFLSFKNNEWCPQEAAGESSWAGASPSIVGQAEVSLLLFPFLYIPWLEDLACSDKLLMGQEILDYISYLQ